MIKNYFSVYLILTICLSLTCCKHPRPITRLFNKTQDIKSKQIISDFAVYNPQQMELLDSVLLVVDYYTTGRNLIKAWDLKNNRSLGSFCKKGLDSNQVLPPIRVCVNYQSNSLSILGKRDFKFATITADSVKSGKTTNLKYASLKQGIVSSLIKIDTSLFANGLYGNKRMAMLDDAGNQLKTFVDYPKIASKLSDEDKFLAYQSNMVVSPDNKRIALAAAFCDNVTFLTLSNNNVQLLKSFQDQAPEFKHTTTGANKVVYKPIGANIKGFVDVKGSDKHLFALYSGESTTKTNGTKTAANIIAVYTWDGAPIKILNTDKKLSYFVVDRQENYLIGISNGPEPVFYQYSLKGVL